MRKFCVHYITLERFNGRIYSLHANWTNNKFLLSLLHDAIMSSMTTDFLMRLFSLVAANQGEPGEPVSG